MTTIVTHSIGTSSRDYSTLQSWEDACPADLTAVDQIWKGECYNDSEFTAAGAVLLSINGMTTDATRYVWLTTASGQSFADNANVATNALNYNQSNGVGFRITGSYAQLLVVASTVDALVEKVQFHYDSTYSSNYSIPIDCGAATKLTLRYFIYRSRRAGSATIDIGVAGTLVNGAVIQAGTTSNAYAIAGSGNVIAVTVVATNGGASGRGIDQDGSGNYPKVIDCAVFGFATAFGSTLASYRAGTGYNASDKASGSMPGSNNQASLTVANEIENATTASTDLRAKSTSTLKNNGQRQAAYTGDLDVALRARSTSTPTIGAWEVIAAAANAFNPLSGRGGAAAQPLVTH